MRIIHQDLKDGIVKVQVQNLDDLWYLSTLIAESDLVRGEAERKVKIGDADTGNAKVVRKTFHITLQVEKVEFSKYTNVLRVGGIITEGPEDIPRGVHQTIDVEPGSVIQVQKETWLSYELDRLKEATKVRTIKVLVVVFDREEAIFGLLKNQGYDLLMRLKGDVRKKAVEEKKAEVFYKEIVKLIQEYVKRYELEQVVVASPSFWKEYLMREVPKELVEKITLAACSDVNETAINEVVRRPELRKILEADRTAREDNLVEDLLAAVLKDLAVYGLRETIERAGEGAVQELLVSDTLVRKLRQEGTFASLENAMRTVEAGKGKVHILSTEGAVQRLDGLGGVAGLLRWKR